MAFLEVLKQMHEKKMQHLSEIIHGKPERIDTDYPMKIRMNCLLRIERTPFILAGEDNLAFAFPCDDFTVEAVGRYDQLKSEFFRFYLRSGNEEAILSIARDATTKVVQEAMFWREIFKIFPRPNGEFGDWDNFVDVNNPSDPQVGVLGCFTFSTPPCLNAPNGNTYEILFPDCSGDATVPFSVDEKITTDPFVEELVSVNHYYAIYGRNIENGVVEKLFVSKDEDPKTAGISILAGIPIDVGVGTFGNSGFLEVL